MLTNVNYIDDNLTEIQQKMIIYSYDNILYSCIFSGFGYFNPIAEKNIKELEKNMQDEKDEESIRNYIPINCIYKKSNTSFKANTNYPKYKWDYNSFDTTISIEAQALAILCLCTASHHTSSNLEVMLMTRTAINIYNFTSSFLRNSSGQFIPAINKASNPCNDLKLKYDEKNVNIYHHILMLEATLNLIKSIKENQIKHSSLIKTLTCQEDSLYLIEYILSLVDALVAMKTDELSLSILSLTRIIGLITDVSILESLNRLLLLLTLELTSRVKITGEMQKSNFKPKPASFLSHIRTKLAIHEVQKNSNSLYLNPNVDKIDNWIKDLYDENYYMFITGKDNQIEYLISDVAEVFLYLLNNFKNEYSEGNLYQLTNFYRSSIENMPLLQAVSNFTFQFDTGEVVLTSEHQLFSIIEKSPVFTRKFNITQSKTPKSKVSRHFSSIEGLYASFLFLHYLT